MTCNLLIMEGSVMALVVVGNPPRLEVDQTGDSVWGAILMVEFMHSQHGLTPNTITW
jgi:hypothetical protein